MSLERLRNILWPVFLPLSMLWAMAMIVRRRVWGRRRFPAASVPVVCFGNVHDGGTGKTPLVLACAKRFASYRPVVVSRGYRGTASSRVESVDAKAADAAARYGDEPVLLASRGVPVVVGRDRKRAIAHAVSQHEAGWALLDDGFQRLSVPKTFAAVVVPADRSPWSAWCWPAGSLREPLSALRHADAIVVTAWPGEEKGALVWERLVKVVAPKIPVYRATGRVEGLVDPRSGAAVPATGPVAALCGIGSPERFFRRLRHKTAVVHEAAFPDHHVFREGELRHFVQVAESAGAKAIVTTAKDWPRLKTMTRYIALPILVLEIGYEVPETLWQDLERRVAERLPPSP